jgi:hypothetical protein
VRAVKQAGGRVKEHGEFEIWYELPTPVDPWPRRASRRTARRARV